MISFWLSPIFAFFALVYLLNLTVGVFEPIPDFLPIFGHIDEFIATVILLFSVRLFFRLLFKKGKMKKDQDNVPQIENLDIIDIESDIKSEEAMDQGEEMIIEQTEVEVKD